MILGAGTHILAVLNESQKTNSSSPEELCLTCGMCCNGVIFADVKLQPGDDPALLRSLGLPLKAVRKSSSKNPQDAPASFFCQPCSALGACHCRIYPDRPQYCREFECALFKVLKAGRTDFAAALQVVRAAHQRADNVRRLLRELGDHGEQVALARRFRRAAKRLEKTGFNEQTADIFSQLTLAVHDLTLLLSETFYPGCSDPVA